MRQINSFVLINPDKANQKSSCFLFCNVFYHVSQTFFDPLLKNSPFPTSKIKKHAIVYPSLDAWQP